MKLATQQPTCNTCASTKKSSSIYSVEYNVVESYWFNAIGIVKVVNSVGQHNLYIGQGEGKDQHKDEQKIAALGVKIDVPSLVKFMYDQRKNTKTT